MKPDSITASAGATALTTNGDADILAAWQRMGEARSAIDALDDCASEQDNALWEAFGRDEKQIQSAIASTLTGAEIQLWCNLIHSVPSADDERAVLNRDLARFVDREGEYDWTERLVISAIRSLRAMQTPKIDTTAWDSALAEYQPIGKQWDDDFAAGVALATAEERDAAYKGFKQRLPEYQAARNRFMAVPAPTIRALAVKMEIADPVDDEHFELCRIDAERLAEGEA